MRDTIHIENLELHAHIGVPEEERAQPQRLTVSITLFPAARFEELADDIRRALNYSIVREIALATATAQPFHLIETLAAEIARALGERFAGAGVTVEVRKFVFDDADYVSVTVVRGRDTAP